MIDQSKQVSKFADDQVSLKPYEYVTNSSQSAHEPQQISKEFDDDEDARSHERCEKYL